MLKIGVIGYSPKVVINNILPFLRELEEDIDTANLDVASMYPKNHYDDETWNINIW